MFALAAAVALPSYAEDLPVVPVNPKPVGVVVENQDKPAKARLFPNLSLKSNKTEEKPSPPPAAPPTTEAVIPAVPSSVKRNLPKAPEIDPNAQKQVVHYGTKLKTDGSNQLMVQAGTNEIVKIAIGHLNRLVTPFSNPEITTASTLTSEIKKNVVYIGTNDTAPVTMYIRQRGSEDTAISLTLLPSRIPPREITLLLPKEVQQQAQYAVNEEAKRWENSNDYIQTIYKTMVSLAKGEQPKGYQLSNMPAGKLPACRQAGLVFDFKSQPQSAIGHHLIYHIGVITNVSATTIEFQEQMCGDWNIAAVASYPLVAIPPGEKTEVYVAERRHYKQSIKRARRSLVGGGQ